MKLTVILLLLLWGNVEFTLTLQECSVLPSVKHAFVLDEYKKAEYQKGDVIYFCCDPGYTTGLNTTYICTERGWSAAIYSQCIEDTFHLFLACTPPPPLTNGYVLQNSTLVFENGQNVGFRCHEFHTMRGRPYKTCTNGQWTGDIQCLKKSCVLPAPNPKRRVVGAEGGRVAAGGQVTVQCVGGSSKQLQCLSSGEWSAPFPTCSDSCDVEHVSDSVVFSPAGVRKLQIGAHLWFHCKNQHHKLQGPGQITCLPDGQWSHKFPLCNDPQSCGAPPFLENGDFFAPSGPLGHNTRVQYLCQAKYTMEGGPHKTCLNGVWTGEIKCLKPCTVNPDLMEPNKIGFRYGREVKLYAPHNDHITFDCVDGATPDGKLAMRQICTDGVMLLPKCV